MATQILIEFWEDGEASERLGEQPGRRHVLKLGRSLSPDERRRVMQSLCQHGRTLQLWLEDEAAEA